MNRTVIKEICQLIRAGMDSWGHTLRLSVIIVVLTVAAVAVVSVR
ncbi:hypothetical protein JOF56_009911 [Kibdelosporangium banguiense]|uniref:Uncharacterized protein n=1 Tax=Kibdelosporangium banguiense TaxID=1365924 RepID=A0ABS4TYS4_9PSEU|nr:hypothetical protein [Kibdelosporangium banguiense]MBP2329526.1 hypothetical protein [Kibdelosporangium banguiense]